jgi:hypothetical protein
MTFFTTKQSIPQWFVPPDIKANMRSKSFPVKSLPYCFFAIVFLLMVKASYPFSIMEAIYNVIEISLF